MNTLNDHNHPFWTVCRLTFLLAVLAVLLWANASHPDVTEIKTWAGMVVAVILSQFAPWAVRKTVDANRS